MHVDHELARRLERVEGRVGASHAETHGRVSGFPATSREIAGTLAIFDGVDSPMTQTFGLGLAAPLTPETLAELEEVFTSRGAPVMHEVCPYAGVEPLALLASRGYTPIELSTVLVQQLAERRVVVPSGLTVRAIAPGDRTRWLDAAIAGWSEDPEIAKVIRSLTEIVLESPVMTHYLVERGGHAIATASLAIVDGIALLAGASTIPAARGAGAQSLLLATRLVEARARGCELAMMVAGVGSASQRNAQRNGFAVAYTRTKWRLAGAR
jgi:hypothetical protein